MVEQLYAAAATGDVAKVKSLVDTVDPDVKSKAGATPLFAAAQKGSLPCVQALIQAGANPNIDANGKTPMQVAFASGKKDIVGALLGATCSSLENIVGAGVGGMADNIDTHGYVPNRDADEVPWDAVDQCKEVTARLAALGQTQPVMRPDASIPADRQISAENQDSELMREEAVRDAMRLIVNTAKQ
jgi:hypothetical protein